MSPIAFLIFMVVALGVGFFIGYRWAIYRGAKLVEFWQEQTMKWRQEALDTLDVLRRAVDGAKNAKPASTEKDESST